MPTLRAKFRRGVARDAGLIVLGLILGGLVWLTGVGARRTAATDAQRGLTLLVRDGCQRSVVKSVAEARSAAADSLRESALAAVPTEDARGFHALSAKVKDDQMATLLRLAGQQLAPATAVARWPATMLPEQIAAGRRFCAREYPLP